MWRFTDRFRHIIAITVLCVPTALLLLPMSGPGPFWGPLFAKSLKLMPTRVAGNWTEVCFGIGIFVLSQLLRLANLGWREMQRRWKENIGIGVLSVAIGWFGLFFYSTYLEIDKINRDARSIGPPKPLPAPPTIGVPLRASKSSHATHNPESHGFSVVIEYVILSFEGREHNTGYWVGAQMPSGCELFPSHLVLFLRITNLDSVPNMITAYSVDANGAVLPRLKTAKNPVFALLPKDSYKGGNIEKTVQFTQGVGQASMVRFAANSADLQHAIPIELTTLDAQIGDKYLEANRSVRGWAFFHYPTEWLIPVKVHVNITDQLGRTFSVPVEIKNGDPNGDALPRTMHLFNPINLTGCKLVPGDQAPY